MRAIGPAVLGPIQFYELNGSFGSLPSSLIKQGAIEKCWVLTTESSSVLVARFTIEGEDWHKSIDDVRRPGTQAVREFFEATGITLDSSSTVRATTLVLLRDSNLNSVPRNAMAFIVGNRDSFLIDHIYIRLVGLVALERMALDRVDRYLAGARQNHIKSARYLRQLVAWRGVFGTDLTEIHDLREQLRGGLRLDARYMEITEELREHKQLYDRKLSVAGVLLGFAATLTSLSGDRVNAFSAGFVQLIQDFAVPVSWLAVLLALFFVGRIRR